MLSLAQPALWRGSFLPVRALGGTRMISSSAAAVAAAAIRIHTQPCASHPTHPPLTTPQQSLSKDRQTIARHSLILKTSQHRFYHTSIHNLSDRDQGRFIRAQLNLLSKQDRERVVQTQLDRLSKSDVEHFVRAHLDRLSPNDRSRLLLSQLQKLTEKEQIMLLRDSLQQCSWKDRTRFVDRLSTESENFGKAGSKERDTQSAEVVGWVKSLWLLIISTSFVGLSVMMFVNLGCLMFPNAAAKLGVEL